MVECSFANSIAVGSIPVAVTETSDFPTVWGKTLLDIQETIECGFTLKCVRDMKKYIFEYSFTN